MPSPRMKWAMSSVLFRHARALISSWSPTPAVPTAPSKRSNDPVPRCITSRCSLGASTMRATRPSHCCRPTSMSASRSISMKCSIPAGPLACAPNGAREQPARAISTPGRTSPTGHRRLPSSTTRSMPASVIAGGTPATRRSTPTERWNASSSCKEYGSTTGPTAAKAARIICRYWNKRCAKTPMSRATPTAWGGNMRCSADTSKPKPNCVAISRCPTRLFTNRRHRRCA